MEKEIIFVNQAVLALKDGFLVKDTKNYIFKLVNGKIIAKGENCSYKLSIEEFMELYKDSKFVIVDDESAGIDINKDEEYYSFKHK